MMDRRAFLRVAPALPLAAGHGALWAAPEAATPRVLVVFLRGAYDCNSLLVGTGSSFYYEARPNIAIARDAALPLDGAWGVHPALQGSLWPLLQRGEVAFVPFAGIHDLSRSHFETQDGIELGQPLGRTRDFSSGFLNRLAQAIGAPAQPIAFTDQLPMAFRGALTVPNISVRAAARPALDTRQSALVSQMYRDTRFASRVAEGFDMREEVTRTLIGEPDGVSRGAISARGFELEARRIARLMQDRYALGFVDIGGWDTHVGQGAVTGYLASRLEELARGLAGFAEESGERWRNTVVVVVSEFGRTFRENGNRGTDHGHGSVYWVLGGGVRGGRVVGEQVAMTQATLHQNRDLPVLNEYRALLGGLFARVYGLTPAQQNAVFAGAPARDLGLL
jgi:uncharacterized protein (DUF1501 family)